MGKTHNTNMQKSPSEPSEGKNTKKTAPYFAREIVFSILLWLPIASLRNASLVCKEWLSIICDPEFLRAYHLDLGLTSLLQEPRFRHYGTYLVTMKGGLLSKIASVPLCITEKIASSCEEFALLKPKEENLDLFVANLATQKVHRLPDSPFSLGEYASYYGLGFDLSLGEYASYYGLGFDPTTKKYKVVCFGRTIGYSAIKCKVLTQGCRTWRPIDQHLDGNIAPGGRSISINGFLHWHENVYTVYSEKIISMDLNNEIFLETTVPNSYRPNHPCAYDLLEIEGCLSLIEYEVGCEIQFEIWTLKDIYNGTWERIFSVSLETIRCNPVQFLDNLYYIGSVYNGKFLLYEQNKKRVSKLNYFVVDVEHQEMKPAPIDFILSPTDISMILPWNARYISMLSMWSRF